jgi:hypothetical protein
MNRGTGPLPKRWEVTLLRTVFHTVGDPVEVP